MAPEKREAANSRKPTTMQREIKAAENLMQVMHSDRAARTGV
jgi:hypothetical protein